MEGQRPVGKRIDFSGYKKVLSMREAYRFDAGTACMRIFQFMITIGTISMLTMAGYSPLAAGTIASVASFSIFLISPRVSKRIDEKGQSAVLPKAILLTLLGVVTLLTNVALGGPAWVCYPAAVLIGFLPSGPSLARTRWTYLLQTGRLGDDPPELKTIYAYEGLIEDIVFMVGPAIAVLLSSTLFPVAGMVFGGVLLAVGTALTVSSKTTEPDAAWRAEMAAASAKSAGQGGVPVKRRSMFIESGAVRMLFASNLLMGMLFGCFDATTISFTQELGYPQAASVVFALSAISSMVVGVVFGTLKLKASRRVQFTVAAILIGALWALVAFVEGLMSLYVVVFIASLVYAPFLICGNALCEQAVPPERLTESLTWLNTGIICGLAIGPTASGAIIDALGAVAGYDLAAVMGLLLALFNVATIPLWKRTMARIEAVRAGD